MAKGSSTTTSTADPQAQASYTGLMQRANRLSMTPYQAYGGELVAGLTPDQQAGFGQLESAFGSQQPYMTAAQNYATLGASPLQQSAIESYLNPYQDQVVKATMNQLQSTEQANNAASMGAGLGAGGLFNDRLGVQQGQLANQEALANAQTLGGLNTQNWQQALAAAQADRNAAAQGAYTFGNLGQENLQAILQGAGATMAAGNQQQQQQQAVDTSGYNQWQIGKAYPYQQIGWAAGVDTGLGSNMGGTSTTTPPAPNPISQYAGPALAAAGMGSNMYQGKSAFSASGGRIPAFADGGAPGMDPGPNSVTSYIPSVNITHGSGPPKPPGSPQQQPSQMPKMPGGGGGSSGVSPIASGTSVGPETEAGVLGPLEGGTVGAEAAAEVAPEAAEGAEAAAELLPLLLLRRGGRAEGGIHLPYGSGGHVRGFADAGVVSPDIDDVADLSGNVELGGFPPRVWSPDLSGGAGGHDPGAFDPEPNMGGADLSGFRPSERNVEMGGIPLPPDKPMHPDTAREELDSSPGLPAFGVPLPQSRGQASPAVRGGPPDDYNPYTPFPGEGGENEPAGSVRPPGGIDRAYAEAKPAERRLLGLGDARAEEGSGRSNALGNALMAAGFGMMANRSPYFGEALGEAGLAGLGAYQGTKKTEEGERRELVKEKLTRDELDAKVKRLNAAQKHSDRVITETERANAAREEHQKALLEQHGKMTPYQQQEIDLKRAAQDPEQVRKLAEAKRLPGIADEDLALMAESYRKGNTGVIQQIGRGTQGPDNLNRFWHHVSEQLRNEGATGSDLAAAKANFTAQSAAARSSAVRESQIATSVEEAKNTFPMALQRSAEVPRSSFVPWNRAVQMVQAGTSSPELARFVTANQAVITAYGQAMSRTGTNSVHAQQHAEMLLSTATSPEAYRAVIEQMGQEMEAAKIAPETVNRAILSHISGRPAEPVKPGVPVGGAPSGGGTPIRVRQNGHIFQKQPGGNYIDMGPG